MNQHQNLCSNCGAEVARNFCPECGQKTTTHRFSIPHVFSHDFIHGILHIDKGFFYTAKEILLRPGKAVRSFIEGQRINHFNYFTFLLLLVAVNHFVMNSTHFKISELYGTTETSSSIDKSQVFLLEHYKQMLFIIIPIHSAFSYLIFRKAKMNYAEHLVMNTYRQGGELLVQTIMLVLFLPFRHLSQAKYIYLIVSLSTTVYSLWFYLQFFTPFYKIKFWVFQRSVLVWVATSIVVGFLASILVKDFLH